MHHPLWKALKMSYTLRIVSRILLGNRLLNECHKSTPRTWHWVEMSSFALGRVGRVGFRSPLTCLQHLPYQEEPTPAFSIS